MSFEAHFLNQLNMHTSMQYQDVIKLCYQASFGAEHILSNIEIARAYLKSEFDSVNPTDEPLFEEISDDVCRINLGAWKERGLPLDVLFKAFCNSAHVRENSEEVFLNYLDIAEQVMKKSMKNYNSEQWHEFLNSYLQTGIQAIHHSLVYRENEKPSYRIVRMDSLKGEWL